jgi:predicted dienelactone hydrolase
VRNSRRLAAAVAIVAATAAACSSGETASTTPATIATNETGAPTSHRSLPATTTTVPNSYEVGEREVSFTDTSRSTAANGSYPGSPKRQLRTLLLYPKLDGEPAHQGAPFPLVLFSHGFDGAPDAYKELLREIAGAGYVVAAPQYPLTHTGAPGGPTVGDVANQPADARFVIDQVLDAKPGADFLRGRVDRARIGVGGHSLGGITTYGLAYNSCCTHENIKAAFAIAGAASAFPRETFFVDNHTPLLAIHGDDDATLMYDAGHDSWERANAPKYFLTVINGAHGSEARGGTTPKQRIVTEAILHFLDAYVRGNTDALTDLTAVGDTTGLTKLEKQT